MNVDVVLVPGAPVVVPELGGAGATEVFPLREAMLSAVTELVAGGREVLVVGADPRCRSLDGGSTTLRRWGMDIRSGEGTEHPHDDVPDPAALAWWLLGAAGQRGARRFVGLDDGDEIACRDGEAVLVVADGPAALTPRAPIPELAEAVALDAAIARWLDEGGDLPDPGRAVAEKVGWTSRPVWTALSGLLGERSGHPAVPPMSTAPYGVGYHVASWGTP